MRYTLLVFILSINCLFGAVTVAMVDGEPVNGSEYQEELKLLPDSLDIMEKRRIAIDNLIERKLLMQYAEEQNIGVSDEEVEAFFIKQFFDYPLFQTEGEFDYAKYYEQRDTERISKILQTMQNDILIDKTRELINRKADFSEDELLDRYIKDNVSLDISYAEFDLDNVSVTRQLTAEGARQYWRIHKEEFNVQPGFKMGFTMIPLKDFTFQAEAIADTVSDLISPDLLISSSNEADSLMTEDLINSIKENYRRRRQKAISDLLVQLAKEKAYSVKNALEMNNPIPYPKLTTGFIEPGEQAGKIPDEILQSVQLMPLGEYSEPYKLKNGFIIYWLIEHQTERNVNLVEVKDAVWESYINDQSFHSQEGEFQRYFFDHLEEFKVPAIQIYRVELFQRKYGREWSLGRKREKIVEELERYLFNPGYMSSVARDNGLQVERRTIYMKRYEYRDKIDEIIAGSVNDGETYGIIEENGREFFYVLENFIPSYIPDFEDLSISDYYQVEVENRIDEETFRAYYNSHKPDFYTADSVKVGGVHCWFDPDSVIVDSAEITSYYDQNYKRFYHDDAVECRYILISDFERARLAKNYLNNGFDHDTVAWAFSDVDYEISDGLVEYKKLPKRIAGLIKSHREYSYLYPVETDKGWLIINKLADYDDGYYDLENVYDSIRNKIAKYRADSLAYSYIRTVFDSTTYFSNCYSYADKKFIFETQLQNIDEPYDEIGDISDLKTSLLRLWRNEKLTRIVETDKGYAVLFMRKKVPAKEQSFEDALPKIKELFAADEQLKLAREYVQGLINDIKKGNNPDSLLFFHNGYIRIPKLSLTSSIPGIQNSSILIDDMLKHDSGYFSPVLKIDSNRLMFYHINDVHKVTRADFLKVKDSYSEEVRKESYENWLREYKKQKEINIML